MALYSKIATRMGQLAARAPKGAAQPLLDAVAARGALLPSTRALVAKARRLKPQTLRRGGIGKSHLTGMNVRSIRQQLGLTQRQLAKRLGIATVTVQKWEQAMTRPLKNSYTRALLAMERGR